jgi:hypothetical protein
MRQLPIIGLGYSGGNQNFSGCEVWNARKKLRGNAG